MDEWCVCVLVLWPAVAATPSHAPLSPPPPSPPAPLDVVGLQRLMRVRATPACFIPSPLAPLSRCGARWITVGDGCCLVLTPACFDMVLCCILAVHVWWVA